MAVAQSSIELAKALPPRLLRFFAKYPPATFSSVAHGSAIPANRRAPKDTLAPVISAEDSTVKTTEISKSLSSVPNASSPSSPETSEEAAVGAIEQLDSRSGSKRPPNPFLPYRNPENGHWRGALIGLRRQADLFKIAAEYNVEPLLPPSIKSSEYKRYAVEDKGKRLKGTGVGEKVKGHKWERTLKGRLEERRQAMMKMPLMIREWKERGHGRGWKKWPK